jgi:bifunctional non-homologous end joining protein LigD
VATTDLSKYVSKRDFSKTAEPGGETTVAPSERRRFVIQKHAARRLHYDLRLELDGVFKSWAVTRGPSLDPKDRRLAVEVEDHPLAYGDFEGTIPRGEYGGGSVQLWDRGYWTPEGNASPQAAIQSGDLKFQLEGQRLHGSWVLVRMKNDRTGGKRTNWLLIKHRDSWSHEGDADALLAEDRSVASGRAMAEIASGKGRGPKPFMLATRKSAKADAVWNSNRGNTAQLRASLQGTAGDIPEKADQNSKAMRIAPKPPPDFIEPQLCRVASRPPAGNDWVHEVKFDGYRLQLRIQHGRASLRTRKGLDWTRKFPAIARAAVDLPDVIIDGEVVAINSQGAPDFAALQAALSDGATDKLIFYAFDLLFADGRDLRELPLAERKDRLKNFLNARHDDASPIRYVEHLTARGDEVLEAARQMGLEGIVSKRLDAPYRSGRTNASWLKVKCRAGQEFVIGAWTDTAGQFRSLLVGVPRDGHLSYIGRVGTGFGQDVVRYLMPRLKAVTIAKIHSVVTMRRVSSPISIGSSPSWLPKWNLRIGPPMGCCAQPRSKVCAKISPPLK